ncbi:hypothetical protein BN6_55370 [Saccharothrix espanaensis DSM 44229]|uniref:Uncharacterized protein n=1 Tax=Saccharothrix espanaensis (strain ATCC 51144 / DSM 44229 / JCM 9112 / NBRC 15066 / NRRL 15764) TaxID=1179773 RepID=K0K3A6_SACES|nr:hypothetical protein BN6_55370 [Saccharothrix espanaensis DSM 44229]
MATADPVMAPSVEVPRQADRRRSFAVISDLDAGKSTLTGALALHARVIFPRPARCTASPAGAGWTRAVEELDLPAASGGDFDPQRFRNASATPVLFGSAVLDFGVRHLLDLLVELAPRPEPRVDVQGRARALDAPFSALVFKVQTGMDPLPPGPDRVCPGLLGGGSARHGRYITGLTSPLWTSFGGKRQARRGRRGRLGTAVEPRFPCGHPAPVRGTSGEGDDHA